MTGWSEKAACAPERLNLPSVAVDRMFFPDKGGSSSAAKRVCAMCPIIDECYARAMAFGSTLSGVWGGTSENERRKTIHARRIAAELAAERKRAIDMALSGLAEAA